MEESISSSRTTTAFYDGNSYHYHYPHNQPLVPAPAPALAPCAPAAVASDFEDDDSGWTAYFLQLGSDEEEEAPASASASASRKKQLRDVGAVPCGKGSASTVSKPNNVDKDNKQAVKKEVPKKTKEVLHLVGATRIVEEEDPLQDTASSPLVQLNLNDAAETFSTDDWSEV